MKAWKNRPQKLLIIGPQRIPKELPKNSQRIPKDHTSEFSNSLHRTWRPKTLSACLSTKFQREGILPAKKIPTCANSALFIKTVILAFYNLFWFLNENSLRTDQIKLQISLKKKSGFVDSRFVKTCDELVIEPEKEQSHWQDPLGMSPYNLQFWADLNGVLVFLFQELSGEQKLKKLDLNEAIR